MTAIVARTLLLLLGVAVAFAGFGLVVAFGVLAFIGMPLLIVGLGVISAATDADR
ncbi:MAG: hypothetical protein ACRD0A_04715 [Acidimicrobiales bacterium]